MFNFKFFSNEKSKKEKENTNANIRMDFEEMNKFHSMLLKYKNRHPTFNLKNVLVKLYPEKNWDAQ